MDGDKIKNQREADFKGLIIKAYIYMLQAKKDSAQININTSCQDESPSNKSYIVYMEDFDGLSQKIKDRIK